MKLKTGILFAILSFAAGTYAEELKKWKTANSQLNSIQTTEV